MQRITGFFSARAWLGVIAAVVLLMNGNQAQAADVMGQITASQPKVFKICKNQTYALCAVASCFVFNKLSYCACDVMRGDSISLPLSFGDNQDACTVNAEGATNGFMVSTFSVPESVVKPQDKQAPPPAGAQALYTETLLCLNSIDTMFERSVAPERTRSAPPPSPTCAWSVI